MSLVSCHILLAFLHPNKFTFFNKKKRKKAGKK